jgi:hypothetical protein
VQNGDSFSTAFYKILNDFDVTQLLTISPANINPKLDENVEDGSWFNNQQIGEALEKLTLASNSVVKVEGSTLYVIPRDESSTVRYEFFGKGTPAAKTNVYKIKNVHNGKKRIITRVKLNDYFFEADDYVLQKYGSNLKSYEIPFIITESRLETIAKNILTEFQYPKQELDITTDYIGSEIKLLDMVTIDSIGFIRGNKYYYGSAIYGESRYVDIEGSVRFEDVVGYKVLSIEHDLKNYYTTLHLRMIGETEVDQYITMT